ncbi:hypothetical protein BIW11_08168 [Tropilaelaps mercedesae]|uniref:Uncharacterized protein n=1 Tax=Tropilaelaps mercedesae TaxID=418985 RepID=A0A1V9XR18_9ACAR|nr:hypothetical protein BIW11_08168 [Tropilaelaps mercedesae]
MKSLVIVLVTIGLIFGDEQCKTAPAESVMNEAQPIAESIMKKCMHLLDKYPVSLNTIGEALRIMCDDYAKCHDNLESLSSDQTKYRAEISKCTRPHLINFCKSRPEIEHDPEKLAEDINDCILEHIPLEKSLGIATGIWVMKILGIPVDGA